MYFFGSEFSPDIYPGLGLLGHMANLFLVFKGASVLPSTVAPPIYIPINSVGRFPFLLLFPFSGEESEAWAN